MRKNKAFNRNSIPFLLLAIIHLMLLFLFAKRSKEKTIWILLLSNIGFAYFFEYPVLNLFKGYSYKPSIMKKRAHDQVLGAVLSQGFYVPVTATLLTIFHKNGYWKLGSTLIYYLIEHTFLRLKIYNTHWWKPVYTLLFMNIYFHISDWFYKAIQARKDWALSLAHYLSIEVIGITLLYISAAGRKIRFGRGMYHSWWEHFAIAPLYSIVHSFFAVKNSAKPGLQPRLCMLLYRVLTDLFLKKIGLLKIKLTQLWGNIPFHVFIVFISRYLYIKIYSEHSGEHIKPIEISCKPDKKGT
ncbi:hypothetical protein [Mesobacillus subterraneus]|uniref:Uncharacterized protein n=1 Tax=Mesobacillus subterraneus TaxID=285983 RepID=A0A3R9F1W4_9BACI|nr:hypothetical protein [Mesobacillus subterraneus]RSD27241.1 hypothetical protein EJA10_11955 [Mesobacillus subterraneus]